MTVRVHCAQLGPVVGDLAGNKARSTAAVGAAAAAGAQVIVLPELVTASYCFVDAAEAAAQAIDLDDPVFADWSAAGDGAVVVGSVAERGSGGEIYNTALVVDGAGIRATYRKVHLWNGELRFFTPGDKPAPVVDTEFGRLGVLICYDLEFPENTRALAVRGAELLVVPTNWPIVDRPAGEHPPELIIAMAAARVNRMAIACCDRTNTERGQAWTEGTAIVDADGWVVTEPIGGVGSVSADLDLERARSKDISARNHLFDDRRPSVYH